ncbi:MAG: TolC family protein [Gammaproteobacteria bacterium]|nr:TolC family protein [Gammaproteobacteria bacterium]
MFYKILLLAMPLGLASLAQGAPLSFANALELAEQHSPALAAQTAGIAAARSMTRPAGTLPDPKLLLGVENVPVSGPDAGSLTDDGMTMQTIGLMQEFPNTAKRQARKDSARARLAREENQQTLIRREVRRAAATAWLTRFYLEQRAVLLDELERENRLFSEVVKAVQMTASATTADGLASRREAAALADRRDNLQREMTAANAELVQWIGVPVLDGLNGSPPTVRVDGDHLHDQLPTHPKLLRYEALTRSAEARLREASAATRPDWEMEVVYGHRGDSFDDLVSLQVSLDLPVSTGSRQHPRIAARRQQLASVDAEREGALRQLRSELDDQLAELARLESQLERTRNTWLPLARDNAHLQLAGYRAGRVPIASVLEARRDWLDQRVRAIDLASEAAITAAGLQLYFGGEQP